MLAQDDHYGDPARLSMAYAEVVNAELHEMQAAGIDVLQLDEPYLQPNPDEARKYAVAAIDRALEGITVPTVVHLCFGYAAVMKEDKLTEAALEQVPADRLVLAPDCGMEYLARDVAFGKLVAMVEGARAVRGT